MPIFQDSDGLAVKFFVQRDLPQQIQAELCETITSLGGRVETKVPRAGYILVQPGTGEEERLRLCWASAERPERHFVPYTYVDACKIAGMRLGQIFVRDGAPIKFHVHPSIANVNARAALCQRIMHSGGDPTASAQSARVILADPNTEVFQHLVKTYQGMPDKFVESYLWVRKCIEKGCIVYTPLVYKNPGGRRPGEERTQFTEEDEEHLCQWVAAKIPYKETGGRTGNRLYQQLCEMAHDPEFAWVTRHTWQSWRERYKKNSARLDVLIGTIVDQNKPLPGEKGQYGYVRKAEEKQKRPRRRRGQQQQQQGADGDPGDAEQGTRQTQDEGTVGAGPSVTTGPTDDASASMRALSPRPEMYSMNTILPDGMVRGLAVRKSPAEEEMDEGDENSEWAIRIGHAAPPSWAKRRASEELHGEASKRQKTSDPTAVNEAPVWQPISAHDRTLHMVDQAIREIAAQFRFTADEVKEYYDKHGDMERTRERFKKMREELERRFNEDNDTA